MEDKQMEAERMAARQKEQQQSYMAHWRVKMNPATAATKSVVPLPIEGAPDKFNPKARRSSAPAGMQLRFKIDKKKSGVNTQQAINSERENSIPIKHTPLRNSASNDETHPRIFVIAPEEGPKSPRSISTSPRETVRHTPYAATARSNRRHSIHTIDAPPSDSENDSGPLLLGTYSATSSPSVSPRSSPTSSFDEMSGPRYYESSGELGRDSPALMSDNEKSQEKLPSFQSIIAETIPPSAMKKDKLPSPVDQEMSKLINKFLVFDNKPAKSALEVTFAPTPMEVHYPR